MTDYTELKNLYLLCFTDDTEEDANILFENVLNKAKCILEHNDSGKAIAMLFLMDANIIFNGVPYPYYYLYAACTHPEYRGKGIMGKLLDKAKQEAIKNNKEGIFLKPANKSLFNFYARYDFTPYFKVCKINTSVMDFTKTFTPDAKDFSEIPLADWYALRKNFLSELSDGYVDFSKEILTTAADGSLAVKSETFGFVYEMRDNTLLVKEALCKKSNISRLFGAISHIAQHTSAEMLEIRLPEGLKEELNYFEDLVQNFSVIWKTPSAKKQNPKSAYHGFAFD